MKRTVTVALLQAKVVEAAELYYVAPGPAASLVSIGDVLSIYLSDGPYVTASTDTPGSWVFHNVLRQGLSYDHELLESQDPPRLAGLAAFSRGAGLSLDNADEKLAGWARALSFDGQPAVVREVELTWSAALAAWIPEPLLTARTVFNGTTAGRMLIPEEGAGLIRFRDGVSAFAAIERPVMLGLGGAVSFNGTTAWASAPWNAAWNSYPSGFAVCMLLRVDAYPVSGQDEIMLWYRSTATRRPLRMYLTTTQLVVDLRTDGPTLVTLTATLTTGQWYWVAVNYQTPGTANLLVGTGLGAADLPPASSSTSIAGSLWGSLTNLFFGTDTDGSAVNPADVAISEMRWYSAFKSRAELELTIGRPLDLDDPDDTADLAAYWPCNERVLTTVADLVNYAVVTGVNIAWESLLEGEADQAGQYWPELLGESKSAPLVPVDQPLQIYAARLGPVQEWRYLYSSNVPLAPTRSWVASDYVFSASAKTITTTTGDFTGMVRDQSILITGAGAGANNGTTKTIAQVISPKVVRTIEALTSVTAATSVTLSTVTPQWVVDGDNVRVLTAFSGELTAHVLGATIGGGYLSTWQDQMSYLSGLAGLSLSVDAGDRAIWECTSYVPPEQKTDEGEGYAPAVNRLMQSIGGWCSVVGSDLIGGIIDPLAVPAGEIPAHKVISIVEASETAEPPQRVPVGYWPAHAVLDNKDSLSAALPSQVAFARLPFRLYRSPDVVTDDFPLAKEPDPLETALIRRRDAKTLAAVAEDIAGGLVWVAQLMPDVDVVAGALYTVFHDRAGFELGRDCWVVGISKDSATQELTVRLLELQSANEDRPA